MLQLTAYASAALVADLAPNLGELDGVRDVVVTPTLDADRVRLQAHVEPTSTELVLGVMRVAGVQPQDVSMSRTTTFWPLAGREDPSVFTEDRGRAEVLADARRDARVRGTYLLNMAAAGVIAGVGVLTGSSILVVGAMAISPDLLPMSAATVGIVERRWRLAGRASLALLIGLTTGALASAGATLLLRIFGRLDPTLDLSESVLGTSLTTLGPGTVLVALAAGMAGMLAFERAGRAAVGVAISVTTIPAAAYIGNALALGRSEPVGGALTVLLTNVVLVLLASTVTLWLRRRHHAATRNTPERTTHPQ